MNTENDFNGYITKEIRKLGTDYKAIKLSDKFKIGLPDWIMFYRGQAVAVESKFVRRLPKRGKVLKHPVTGPQISYLSSLSMAGVTCKVIVGAAFDSHIYVLDFTELPVGGNFYPTDFSWMKAKCRINRIQDLMDLLFMGVIVR